MKKGRIFPTGLDRGNPATARIYSLLQEIYTEFREQQEGFALMIKIKLQTIFTEIIRHYVMSIAEKPTGRFPRKTSNCSIR